MKQLNLLLVGLGLLVASGAAFAEPAPKVRASFGHEQDAAISKAYESFKKTHHPLDLKKPGFTTFAYDSRGYFPVACEPLRLCVIQLEQGENINNIDIGDSANWLVSTSLIGTPEKGAYQLAIKPEIYNIETDLVVTTTRRTYNIGLVSKEQANTHAVSFYYPNDMLQAATQKAHLLQDKQQQQAKVSVAEVDVSQLNFDYHLRGNTAYYKPVRVFDDNYKTFIEMPRQIAQGNLPIFYIVENGRSELVNYRYKAPYFIIDRLFKKGLLVSGKGRHKTSIAITNKHLKG